MPKPIALSKSRYTAGLQCHKLLWWRVHEPDAPELTPSETQQAVFDTGTAVGVRARDFVPGGVLIGGEPWDKRRKTAETEAALRGGAQVIYEASFEHGGVFAAIDILERSRDGVVLHEVKSTTKVKPEQIPDVAVQRWVAEGAGLKVTRTNLVHLNRECRAPDLSNLFTFTDVTAEARVFVPGVESEVSAQLKMLAGPLPQVKIGDHCDSPYECPFKARCWPERPPHHIDTLPRLSDKKRAALSALGVETIERIPRDFELTEIQERQRRAVVSGEMLIEPDLKRELKAFEGERIAFLDFETVGEAIPVWDGCRPYDQVPVQFSCHVRDAHGTLSHFQWIAPNGKDPRPEMAHRVIEACRGADIVVAFNASFEKQCLKVLAEAAPTRAAELEAIIAKVKDLADPVRKGIYHPEFYGSYSLKPVVGALLPELSYDQLDVGEGTLASARLHQLLFELDSFGSGEADATRAQLYEYCGRDTLVMVKLLEKLRELVRSN